MDRRPSLAIAYTCMLYRKFASSIAMADATMRPLMVDRNRASSFEFADVRWRLHTFFKH